MKLYADVNFDGRVVRELRRLGVDVLTAQEDGQSETPDVELLDRATELGRLLCTFDDDLLIEATRRQRAGESFSGVLFARQQRLSVGEMVQDLLLIAEVTHENDWRSQTGYLPL